MDGARRRHRTIRRYLHLVHNSIAVAAPDVPRTQCPLLLLIDHHRKTFETTTITTSPSCVGKKHRRGIQPPSFPIPANARK